MGIRLIYADQNGIELGEVLDYDLDTAIGKDENTFTLTVPLGYLEQLKSEDRPIKEHYRIYADGTELGGLVDNINPNTGEDTVIFDGRTWSGILYNRLIEPPSTGTYYIANGEGNAVLTALIAYLGLTSLFKVSTVVSTVYIKNYQFTRYISCYLGICKMLYANDAKLQISYSDGYVNLSVVPMYDYSQTDEFDSSQLDFSITKNYRPVNHVVLTSGDNLDDNYTIHLFADKNGGVQPYASVSNPYKDSHYILDKRNQVLTGFDEVCQLDDSGSGSAKSNYILLTSQPTGWGDSTSPGYFTNYYYQNTDKSSFVKNEEKNITSYTLQTSQVSDWVSNYSNYYTKSATVNSDGEYTYSAVNPVETYSYNALGINRPSDWDDNYDDYFYKYNDGTTITYPSVSAQSVTKYNVQTSKPSTWDSGYASFYTRTQVTQYKYEVKTKLGSTWVLTYEYEDSQINNIKTSTYVKTFIKRVTKRWQYNAVTLTTSGKVPKWKEKTYYTSYSENVIPTWADNYFYEKVTTSGAPTWTTNKYYTKSTQTKIIPFATETYYEKFDDHYQTLVEKGISILSKSYDCDSIDIDLDADGYEYDINDIVGAREQVTGIFASQPVIKKIYKIKNEIQTITYEIGAWE